MVKRKRFERLKPRPSHKSAQVRVNYTLLVPLILFTQSTDLLCSEALGQKRGVATDTQGPKTAAQISSLCAHNSHKQYGCSASHTMTSATVSVTTLSPRYRSVLTTFLLLRYRNLKQREGSHSTAIFNRC